MEMKKIKRASIFLVLLAAILFLSACGNKDGDFVAKVDGEGITVKDFEDTYKRNKTNYLSQYGEDILNRELDGGMTMNDHIIDESISKLVMEKIIRNDAKKRNISVSKEELEEITSEYIERIGGEESFKDNLKQIGSNREEFEKELEFMKLMDKHKQAIKDDSKIKEAELKKYYKKNKEALEMVRASHIVIEKEDRQKAEAIKKRLDKGEDFEAIAKEESKDFQSATNGGDLGYFQKGMRAKEFEDAAFAMEIGQISDIVETDVALHIIKLVDKKDSFEDLKDGIEENLKEDAYMEEIHSLVAKSSIEILKEKIDELDFIDRQEGKELEEDKQEEKKED